MARIFDVIEYPNEMRDEIVHRFPETGIGDFRIGSQVIVRESQAAVFFRDGQALDVFRAGRHTITTANIPLMVNLIGKLFNDRVTSLSDDALAFMGQLGSHVIVRMGHFSQGSETIEL